MRSAGPRWVFDELPPSGARRGGDPSEHAFRGDLESFVREVVQNANDQAVGWPAVRFRLRELSGDELRAYLDALSFETLRAHLEAAARLKGGASVREFLEEYDRRQALLVVNVEDRNTMGLTGAESEGESHYRALCKDTLYSHKTSASAGGSYGLGKSVLWTFSGLSTVLFNSILLEPAPGQRSPRMIGRAELPSHATEDGVWYSGSGWFGAPTEVARGALRAESLWAETAADHAAILGLERTAEQPGTSIQIVGFRDPTRDADESTAVIGRRIASAAARWFWPAMVSRRKLRVSVDVGEGERAVDADAYPEVAPFVDCYRRRDETSATLERPGDVVVRQIAVDVPATKAGGASVRGSVELVVRLAAERDDPRVGHVAMFRGAGMVVRYWDRRALTIGMRPFHAILVCGQARRSEPSHEDLEVERFLRAAEPPGHDEWRRTSTLQQAYKKGWGTALERLHQRVSEELRLLLAPRVTQGERGPDRLQRRFPIGPRGGSKGSAPTAFRFSRLAARLVEDRWTFEGEVEPVERVGAWRAAIRLRELGEDGAAVDEIAIESLEIEAPGADVALGSGEAQVSAPKHVKGVAFRGRSASLAGREDPPGELCVEVTGTLEPA